MEREMEMGAEGAQTSGGRGGTAVTSDAGPADERLSSIGELQAWLRAGGQG